MQKEITIAEIKTQEYIANYRNIDKFMEFCKNCGNYNKLWSCPPFEEESKIDQFSTATIIGVKINVDESTRSKASSNATEQNALMREILSEVRGEIDEKLLILEQQNQPSLLYYAGCCRICYPQECTRKRNEPCLHPDKMRSSLEADGFDIGRTTSELLNIELKWCSNNELPPYFTLVYGLCTNQSIIEKVKNEFGEISEIESITVTQNVQ